MTVATYYYLDDWTDEVLPCAPTLDGWAAWLSQPDEGWGRDTAEEDGSLHKGSTLVVLADLNVTLTASGIDLPDLPHDANGVFVRFGGPDTGWNADMHTYRGANGDHGDEAFRREIARMLREDTGMADGDTACLAVVQDGPAFVGRYAMTADGPRLTIEGAVQ